MIDATYNDSFSAFVRDHEQRIRRPLPVAPSAKRDALELARLAFEAGYVRATDKPAVKT